GGFVAAESVWRSKATGGDIPTAFSSLPYEGADAYKLSEFFGSARQSRLTLLAEGKMPWGTVKGYYEADFLGTGISSNNNQSNSYVLRQRVLYAQAETNSHWSFTGGQLWSLAAEQKKGITANPGDVASPQTIDPNYVPGFVWTRQYGFRVVKNAKNYAFGISVENPQMLYSPTLAGNTPYAVIGSAGANGGNYNAGLSGYTATTYVQNYISESGTPSYLPVYNTVTVASNAANLTFNYAPDVLVKVTADQPWGHFEAFGVGRFAHETVYLDATTDRIKYGGQTDIAGFNGGKMGGAVVAKADSKNAISNTIALGGVGGSGRILLMNKKLSLGAKGLWGTGMGRYGNTTLPDLTNNDWGGFSPLHSVSGLATVEVNPTPRLVIWANYGGDYVGRNDWSRATDTTLGSPTATFCPTTAASAADCVTKPTPLQLAAGGTWGGHWSIPKQAAVGYGSRFLSTASCASTATPPYNSGGSTGYLPGGSCGAQTRNVQEVTGGYWYDLYKGDRGRLRQGIQYGYAVREGWSSSDTTLGLKGVDNMFWTSFRYYLP
ncbi:MAG TPA: hypothetical protein VMB75_10605, partial [Rhodocyclaceae bacterium]|nr:hypothetical protein [Rhodocyclaceae bacterium]